MTLRSISDEHLTEAIRNDLKRKVDKYVNRDESERDKVVIFTDNATLWKLTGPNERFTSIRTDEPLPPIPPDYNRQRDYNIVDEMNWFIGEYTSASEYDIDWNLYDTGDDDTPRVHVHFASDHLEPAWLFLDKDPQTDCEGNPPPVSSAPSTATEVSRCVGKSRFRFLSLSTISERSSVTSVSTPLDGPSRARRVATSALDSLEGVSTDAEDGVGDVFEDAQEQPSATGDDRPSPVDDNEG